ncbi:GntR family transcriptional regulator [Mariniphaga sp.]|uniref:GntR family transcriptional regulator n=1 Tax=Mariniphaga sp. TaxID=1954475 RepID=UPI0035686413
MADLPFRISEKAGQTKIQQLVHSISEAISSGQLKEGETLPSVNELSTESGFSRDTVFKAYKILKERNLVESAPTRGYYVTGGSFKVFMLLDDFSAFKEQLYKAFRNNLPNTYSVDLLFHHYNREVFNQLVNSSLGRYSMSVVMNIDHRSMEPVLKKIDPGKLLILDMGMPPSENISYVIQDFNKAVENCLEEGLTYLKKYSEMILVYDETETPHPAETVTAVRRFCENHNISFRLLKNTHGVEVKKEQCWFTIRDSDLVEVIKYCRSKGFLLGKDFGVLSYNDTPMKQIAGGGISVISTDFEQMGRLAARFVKDKQKVTEVLSTSLKIRQSL